MRMNPMVLAVSLLISPCLTPGAASASLAPTTPTFVLKWGAPGSGPGQFSAPGGIAADALGNVFVTDFENHRIQKFDRMGNVITQWGSFGSGNGQFNHPYFVAAGPNGDVYVSDYDN